MTNPRQTAAVEAELRAEIIRLNKVVQALMNRAERSTSLQSSDFNQFQTAVLLQELVRQRTQELEAALIENKKVNQALREAEQKFHSVLDQSLVGITMTIDNRFHYANPKFAEILGYSVDEILGLGPLDIAPESDRAFIGEVTHRGLAGAFKQITYSVNAIRKDGATITVEISGNEPVNIGGKPALIAVWVDITERLRIQREVQALQEQLQDQAIHDPLTGLYNRLFLNESLEREFALAQRHGYAISAVMTDLDHFKTVNDRHGHLAGDAALRHFAGIMKQHSRASDINCRYGGEEFFLVLPDTTAEIALQRAEELRLALAAEPVKWRADLIPITASFGVATFPLHGVSSTDLIDAADIALYAAKTSGRNQVKLYNRDTTAKTQ